MKQSSYCFASNKRTNMTNGLKCLNKSNNRSTTTKALSKLNNRPSHNNMTVAPIKSSSAKYLTTAKIMHWLIMPGAYSYTVTAGPSLTSSSSKPLGKTSHLIFLCFSFNNEIVPLHAIKILIQIISEHGQVTKSIESIGEFVQ